LALKEFILSYQYRIILSDAILIEKAKLLARGLGVPENTLLFSSGWLYSFKKRNGIQQIKLQGEAASANEIAIEEAIPLLQNKCAEYTCDRVYNMDETGLFYQ
jgi:Tc5 transposase DNA-binding domain